jgi:ArsR family transcriptional regulator
MNAEMAVECFSALGHAGRMALYRRLIEAGPEGMKAGDIAQVCQLPDSTASAQLTTLTQSGLISAHRQGRSIRYLVNTGRLGELMSYLIQDCCGGRPEICQDLAVSLFPTHAPSPVACEPYHEPKPA